MKKEHVVKLHLLKKLADGQFHSGEVLGSELGISRAAISKHINALQDWGVDVYRIQGRGYQLAQPLRLLDKEQLQGDSIELIPVIDSTNQYLLDRLNSFESGHVCLAEYQSQGRGRRGRQWFSPFGSNLYMSMYWKLDAGMAAAMGLSLVVGIAAVEALESLGIDGVKLKWPNDVYYQDKKLAGILVEMSGQAGGAAHLVIGMGLNIQMAMATDKIDQPWTALNSIDSAKDIDRNQLAIALIAKWRDALRQYESLGLNGFIERWNRLDNYRGRQVRLLMGPREVIGEVQGIDNLGGVVIKNSEGTQAYVGGEISLRAND
ncbi:TPA: bifunctional biotin--[acetyl-CoA-carboxylase] ligase/biotin operon repressor BirA [Vibrio vulnificus]|uniref:bifunctional biotin--[acetyl-CoA-carboxylase] ligase/biotin operon repressor BirA n=1 Tax=Vibrio sp. 05-20-BW147 TaxID=2575834 RepID=UPI0015931C9E|nr:bifunctional biotin--[acetyl-CoA-carboxylase] ligase/biotin operon repressor BirA [Vibrio sp. 05-20-BW147]NVC65259.1 bifunctional biotin--[acetyl-CoA-carboxylase] ligase/biotin operon repressor BirA [Vibrio sp. 05-20-BW147]HAS6350240.1 bifunctional biotin--[acetyl-CoA-carboxylase] ligase/biotin operon repressor BirA [Vibrio vulnificus]